MTSSEFENLILLKKDKLYRFALSILRNKEDAKDAVQDVVVKLWKNKRLLNTKNNIDSFCLNAVKNHCLDVIRKQKHKTNYENSLLTNPTEKWNYENKDLVEKLQQELLNLPEQQRMAIELKDFQGYDYEEISEILDLSINAIRVNVSRGRKRLHQIFKEELKDA